MVGSNIFIVAGVQADFYRSYGGDEEGSGGRKIFYRNSKLIGDLQSADNFKNDYYDLEGGGWMSPPPDQGTLESVRRSVSDSPTSADRSTCFVIPSGSSVETLMLPSRVLDHSPTAMEFAIHDMCDNSEEVTIVPVVGKVSVEVKENKVAVDVDVEKKKENKKKEKKKAKKEKKEQKKKGELVGRGEGKGKGGRAEEVLYLTFI